MAKSATNLSLDSDAKQASIQLFAELQFMIPKWVRTNSNHEILLIRPCERRSQQLPHQSQLGDSHRFSSGKCIQCCLPAL